MAYIPGFKRNSKGEFDIDNNFVSLKNGSEAYLLEDELNEMQWIQYEQRAQLTRQTMNSGFLNPLSISDSNSNVDATFYLKSFSNPDVTTNKILLNIQKYIPININGYTFRLLGTYKKTIANGSTSNNNMIIDIPTPPTSGDRYDLVYLEVWFEEINAIDNKEIKKYGSKNNIKLKDYDHDKRLNVETSRRIQLKWEIKVASGKSRLEDIKPANNANCTNYIPAVNSGHKANPYTLDRNLYISENFVTVTPPLSSDNTANKPGIDGIYYAIPLLKIKRTANKAQLLIGDVSNIAPTTSLYINKIESNSLLIGKTNPADNDIIINNNVGEVQCLKTINSVKQTTTVNANKFKIGQINNVETDVMLQKNNSNGLSVTNNKATNETIQIKGGSIRIGLGVNPVNEDAVLQKNTSNILVAMDGKASGSDTIQTKSRSVRIGTGLTSGDTDVVLQKNTSNILVAMDGKATGSDTIQTKSKSVRIGTGLTSGDTDVILQRNSSNNLSVTNSRGVSIQVKSGSIRIGSGVDSENNDIVLKKNAHDNLSIVNHNNSTIQAKLASVRIGSGSDPGSGDLMLSKLDDFTFRMQKDTNDLNGFSSLLARTIKIATSSGGVSGGEIKVDDNKNFHIKKRDSQNAEVYSDLTVGNLTVKGSTVTIESETVKIADNFISLNSNISANASPTESAGIEVNRGNQNVSRITWNETNDYWQCGILGSEDRILGATNPTINGLLTIDGGSRAMPLKIISTNTSTIGIGIYQDAQNSRGSVRYNLTDGWEVQDRVNTTLHTRRLCCIDSNTNICSSKGTVAYSATRSGTSTPTAVGNKALYCKTNTRQLFFDNASGDLINVGRPLDLPDCDSNFKYNSTAAPTKTTKLTYDGYFYATRVYNAVYNDYAEYFEKGNDEIEPGDVIVKCEETNKFIKANREYHNLVVGVCSDSYGFMLGGTGDEEHDKENYIPLGLSGRVNVKVTGVVKKGDLLVSSEIPGVAKSMSNFIPGTVIGKALEDNNGTKITRINMLIMNC